MACLFQVQDPSASSSPGFEHQPSPLSDSLSGPLFQFPLMFWGWFSKVYESLHSQTLRSKKNVEPSSDLRERESKKRMNKQTDKQRQMLLKVGENF